MEEEKRISVKDATKVEVALVPKESKIYAVKKLSKWFEMDISIKMFGVTVFSWHFPPSV